MCWRRLHRDTNLTLLFLSSTVNDIRRKLDMVGIHSTVGELAKRMLDPSVETTQLQCVPVLSFFVTIS